MTFVLYTEKELSTIYRSFGHAAIRATEGLLRREKGGLLDHTTRQTIEQILKDCRSCNVHATDPHRFKTTVGASDLRLNPTVQVDTMFLNDNPILHMVDVAIDFCTTAFHCTKSAKDIWSSVQRM